MKTLLGFICVSLLLLTSCERYQDVALDVPFDEKVVANCFLNPNENTVSVWLQKTVPVLNSEPIYEPYWLSDADVSIQTPTGVIVLTYDSMARIYSADVSSNPIEKGGTYKLNVIHPLQSTSGVTTIPQPTDVKLDLVFDTTYSTYLGKTYRAKIKCQNTGANEAYILMSPLIQLFDSMYYPLYFNSANRVQLIKPGQTIEQVFTTPAAGVSVAKVMVNCYTTDMYYAKYINKNSAFDFSSIGVPYAEASVTYSNMSNKIGLMGSYYEFHTQIFDLSK